MKKNNIILMQLIIDVIITIFVSSIFGIGYSNFLPGFWSYVATAWFAMWLYNKCFHQLNTKEDK